MNKEVESRSGSRSRRTTAGRQAGFPATRWSRVGRAGGCPSTRGSRREEALEGLCRDYWFPLYAFIRRSGRDPAEAEDLTQSFFQHLLARGGLKKADRDRGRFRTFLLGALTNFLHNEWRRGQAVKRGGGLMFVAWDELGAEERYADREADDCSPEHLYDRAWAETIMNAAIRALQDEYERVGQRAVFEDLKAYLGEAQALGSYRVLAAKYGTSEGAMKVRVMRFRRRFGELLRWTIADTTEGQGMVEEELRYLASLWG